MNKLLPVIIFISACNVSAPDNSKTAMEEIILTDKAMSAEAAKSGFFTTLLKYADEDVVKPQEGNFPVIGKNALAKSWEGKPDTKNISWEPYKAEASKSGELGYTLGNWKMISGDSAFYGNYYTVWKKQSDGTWKFVVDGGNNTPSPVSK